MITKRIQIVTDSRERQQDVLSSFLISRYGDTAWEPAAFYFGDSLHILSERLIEKFGADATILNRLLERFELNEDEFKEFQATLSALELGSSLYNVTDIRY